MEIKQIVSQAIAQVESEKQRQISLSKEKVIREKIVPFNNEIDRARDKAINELATKLTQDIEALRVKFEQEKKNLIDMGEQKKADFQRTAVEAEIATVNAQSTIAKSKLEKILQELGD